MSTNRKLTIGIIVLLVLNLIVLGFFMTRDKRDGKDSNQKRQHPKQIIADRLDFNEEQVASFNSLIETHKKDIRAKDEEIKQVKNVIFTSLGSDAPVNIDSLGTKIGNLQKEIEVAHYEHFLRVKDLCNEDQIVKFNALSKDLSKMFSSRGRSSKNRNKESNSREKK